MLSILQVVLLGVVFGLGVLLDVHDGVVEAITQSLVYVGVLGVDGKYLAVIDLGRVGLLEVEVELGSIHVELLLLVLADVRVVEDGEAARECFQKRKRLR